MKNSIRHYFTDTDNKPSRTFSSVSLMNNQPTDTIVWEFNEDGDHDVLPPMTRTEILNHVPHSIAIRDLRNVFDSGTSRGIW